MLDRVKAKLPTNEFILLYPPDWIKQLSQRFEAKETPENVVAGWLKKVQRRVSAGERPRVYTVANCGGVHWLALEIDFEKRIVAYGDSQGGSQSSARFRKIIREWLTRTWPGEWDNFETQELPHGDQESDGSSCGICAINTIEARILGNPLWEPKLSAAFRASKFLEISQHVIEQSAAHIFAPKFSYIEDELRKVEIIPAGSDRQKSSDSSQQERQMLISKKEGSSNQVRPPIEAELPGEPRPSQSTLRRFFSIGSSMEKLSTATRKLRLRQPSEAKASKSSIGSDGNSSDQGSSYNPMALVSPSRDFEPDSQSFPENEPTPAKSPSPNWSVPPPPESIASSTFGDLSSNGDGSNQ
ncbi:hypothetical protein FRC11_003437, partial [Ceratobasidium sp. 423]